MKRILLLILLVFGISKGFAQYSGTGTFTKVTSLAGLTDGYYVITNEFSEYLMTNGRSGSATTGFFVSADATFTSGNFVNPLASNVWKIETNGSGKTIYNEGIARYVGWSSGNGASIENAIANTNRWTFTYASNKFTVNNVAETVRQLSYNSGNPRFAAYGNATQEELQFYKLASATSINLQGASNNITNGATSVSTINLTNFGNQDVASGTVARTFTIQNTGSAVLNLTGNPIIALSGDTSDFKVSLTPTPSATVAASGNTAFEITFDPTTTGARNAKVSIANNDATKNPYTFAIQGTGISPATTVSVTALSNFTYVLGNGPSTSQSFNVSGSNLTANLVVTPPADYEISETAGGTYSSAAISFAPSSGSVTAKSIYVKLKAGLAVANYNETINVTSTNATIKTVAVSGSVTAPAPKMAVKGNNTLIVSGTTSTSTTNATDFGSTPINTTVTKTYTIENTGSADLILPSNPINFGGTGTGFTHTEPLLSTIAAGGSTTFTVSFNNAAAGVHNDNVLIASNDNGSDNSTFDFAIKATATDIPVNPSGTISGTTPACTSTTLAYTGAIPADETYYWQTSPTGTSQTNSAVSTYAVSLSATYYVRAYKNGAWSAGASTGYAVVVNAPVVITVNPVETNVPLCLGDGNSFPALTVTATGTSLSYQWYKSTDNSNATAADDVLVGENSPSYTPSNTDTGTFYYYVIVSGASPCTPETAAISGPRTVNAKPATPQGTITPISSCGAANLTYTFAPGEATDGNVYYWQNLETGANTTVPVLGTTTQTISGTRYVRARNAAGCWSDAISQSITISTAAGILTQPNSTSVQIPVAKTFTVVESGTAPFTYQWQLSVDGGTIWADIASATSASYSTGATSEEMNGYKYQCIITNSCGTITSNVGTLALTNASPNNGLGLTTKVCRGNTSIDLSWTASTTSGTIGYIVFVRDGNNIPQATAAVAGNAVGYVANANITLANEYGNLGKAVYKGNGLSVIINGLTPGASYTYKVVAYTGENITGWSNSINNTTTSSSYILINSVAKVPEVSNLAATIAPTSSSLSWNVVPNSSGCYEYMLVANQGTVTFVPSGDGTAYTALTAYAGNNQVIYKGTGNSVTVTGLTEGLSYCYKVFVRKEGSSEWSEGVFVCQTTGFNYCESYSSTDAFTAGIKGVKLNTINTNDNASENVTYTDRTSQRTDLNIGETYGLTVKVSSGGTAVAYTKVWIDWNRNGTFDSNEAYELGGVSSGNPATNITTLPVYNITVPTGAPLGLTRMRITLHYKSGQTYSTPCKQEDFSGEVEDYTINIARPLGAEIEIKGGNPGQVIASGTNVATGLNGTLFASATLGATPQEKEYTIENSGLSALLLNGTPSISLLGANPADFTITQYPSTSIASASSTTFKIAFAPLQSGVRSALVSIANNDTTGGENPYTFLIQGTATCATIAHTVTPVSGPVGTIVTINATSGNLTGASVSFNGIVATAITPVSATEIKVVVPSGATTGSLSITNAQGCSGSGSFNVITEMIGSCEGNNATVPTDLFISQITDSGIGDLTYIELYNGTGSPVNLASGLYGLSISNNGASGYSSVGALTGTIASGDTFVVAIGASTLPCDGAVTGGNPNGFADLVFSSAGVNFNASGNNSQGHDCITLSKNGNPLDRWGVYQDQTWASSLNLGGKGANFIRKNNTTLPNANYNNNDWIITDWGDTCADLDYSDVGSHDFSTGLPPTITAQPTFADQCGATSLTVQASEGFGGGHALAYQWFFSVPGQTTWSEVIDGGIYAGATASTLTISSLAGIENHQYYVQVRENTVTCYTASHAVSVAGAFATITWNGTDWIGGLPDNTKNAIINGFYNTSVSGNLTVRSLINNSTVTIASNNFIKIEYGLVNNDIFEIKDSGSLVQVCDQAINSGNVIKVERISKPMYRYDFTYWSSPVTPQTLENLSPTTLANKYFYWDANYQDWTHILKTQVMQKGVGYIVRAPEGFSINPLVRQTHTGNFRGYANNGVIAVPIAGNASPSIEKWNLIGNPFPSAIHADLFLDSPINAGLEGTVYVWTHNTPVDPTPNPETGLYEYAENDYAVYNALGGTATTPGAAVYLGYIASGQSFFVKGIDTNGDATFNNSMRVVEHNGQFLRNSNNTAVGKSRIWLNLKDARNGFNQMLVGYATGATNGLDRKFDGGVFGGNAVSLYSIASNKNLTVQGRALPFNTDDTVDLGYKATTSGTLKISLDNFDGLFTDQNIYLEDKMLNIIHNLKTSDYTFDSAAGTFNTRFVLRYTSETLANPDFEAINNSVIVSVNGKSITLKSSTENIKNVMVYDILGKNIYENKKVNAREFYIQDANAHQQALIIKIYLENGAVVNKKILVGK